MMQEGNFDVILLQDQKQLIKQDQIQLQEQELANFFMLRPIANLESFTISLLRQKNKGIPQKYGYYDINDGLNKKPPEELLEEAKFNNALFDDSYRDFAKKYKKFLFPDNLSKEEIINDINTWEKRLTKEFGKDNQFSLEEVLETFETVKNSLNGNGPGFKNLKNLKTPMTEEEKSEFLPSLMKLGVTVRRTIGKMVNGIKNTIDSGKTYQVMAKLNMSYRDNPNFRHLWDPDFYNENVK